MRVEVRNNDVSAAMYKLKKMMRKENVIQEYMDHTAYEKPSDKKRRKRKESIRAYQKKKQEELLERGY